MKVLAVALVVLGMLCSSTLATAEGPVPFRALMATAGAESRVPAINSAQDNSATPSTKPAHPASMTSGGKAMTGVGIGLLACGGVIIAGTAALSGWGSSSKRGALYGGGAGLAATGTILIALGVHRRSAQ